VKKLANGPVEVKYQDIVFQAGVTSAGAIVLITNIPQGITDNSRVGDQLMIKDMFLNLTAVVADTSNLVRFIIFQWKPQSIPVVSDILFNGPTLNPDVWSQYSNDTRQDYRIIFDSLNSMIGNGTVVPVTLSQYPPQDSSQPIIAWNRRMIAPIKRVQYVGGSTTVASNLCYILYISDSAPLAPPHPVVTGVIRTHYTDA